jgi:CRISPR/Cas system-associated endonuclease/helicase Cas3
MAKEINVVVFYERAVEFSKELMTRHKNAYNPNAMQCLAAAQIASSAKKVVYCRINPGNGKTFALLALAVLIFIEPQKFLYPIPYEYLVDDVLEKSKMFEHLKMIVQVSSALDDEPIT